MSTYPCDVSVFGLVAFSVFFLYRYVRVFVGIYAFLTYKPKTIANIPQFNSLSVSVIIPTTFKSPTELIHCVGRILSNNPATIFVVTANANVQALRELCITNNFGDKVMVLGVEHLNKRNQILEAMQHIVTDITVLADDDVFWPDNYLPSLLAIFEDPKVGAGGTRQRVHRNDRPDFWNFLGIAYLERRVWNNCATNAIDGSISTLSGRTAGYRTEILKSAEFKHYFTNDTWRGKPLNSDDDKCLTRYVYSHGWNIVLQFDPNSVIETTVEGDSKYLSQCMRWARAHWRGNFTVMENETYWCSRQYIWGMYYIYAGSFLTPAVLIDGLLFCLMKCALVGSSSSTAFSSYIGLAIWVCFTKIHKLIPHFLRYPTDIQFIPASIIFSYLHGIINVYAALTLTKTHWGSQNLKELEKSRAGPQKLDIMRTDSVLVTKEVITKDENKVRASSPVTPAPCFEYLNGGFESD